MSTSTPLQKITAPRLLMVALLAVLMFAFPCLLNAQETPPNGAGRSNLPAEVQEADALFAEGKYEEALEKYQEALEKYQAAHASDAVKKTRALEPQIVVRRAECFIELERFIEAIPGLSQVISLLSKAEEFRDFVAHATLLRGRCYAGIKDYQLALTDMTAAINMTVNQSLALMASLERGKVYMEQGQPERALSDFTTGTARAPTHVEFLYNRGAALMQVANQLAMDMNREGAAQNHADAVAMFDRAIELKPDYVEAIYDRGLARAQTGGFEEALEDIQKAVDLDSTNVEYNRQLAFAILQQARTAAAEEAETGDPEKKAEALEEYNKGLAVLGQALALVQSKSGDERTEEDDAERLNIWIKQAETYVSMARLLPEAQRTGQYNAAIAVCEEALTEEPRISTALYWRGIAERLSDNLDAAIETFTKVVDTAQPDLASDARLRRGIVLFHQGDWELALEDFDDTSYNPEDPRPMFWAGLTHARMGDFHDAIESYSLAIRNDSRFTLAYTNRGLAHLQAGEFERAVHDFNQPLRFNHRDATAYFRRGFAQEQLGRSEQAQYSYKRALNWNPQLSAASEGLRRVAGKQ